MLEKHGENYILIKYFLASIFLKLFPPVKSVSKAIRFWDFSYETAYETLLKKGENVEKG
jgi:hypothetical protein